MSQFLDKAFLVCGVILFIWTLFLYGRRIFNNSKYGKVIIKVKDLNCYFDLMLGLLMAAISLADMVRCIIYETGLDNRFYLMAAFAVYLLYKGIVLIEFRDDGIFARESNYRWNNIKSHEWKCNKKGNRCELAINIKNGVRRVILIAKPIDKADIDGIITEKTDFGEKTPEINEGIGPDAPAENEQNNEA